MAGQDEAVRHEAPSTPDETLRLYAREMQQIRELLRSQENAAAVLEEAQKKAAAELLAEQRRAADGVREAQQQAIAEVPDEYREELAAVFSASREALEQTEARIAALLVEAQRQAAAVLLEATMKVRDRWAAEADTRQDAEAEARGVSPMDRALPRG